MCAEKATAQGNRFSMVHRTQTTPSPVTFMDQNHVM